MAMITSPRKSCYSLKRGTSSTLFTDALHIVQKRKRSNMLVVVASLVASAFASFVT